MFPIINIGPLAVQASGFFITLSLFLGLWLTGILAKNIGSNGEIIENSILFGLISGIIGARLGFLLKSPFLLSENPLAVFSLSTTMLDTSFGLFTGVMTAIIYAQKKHFPLWPTLDTLSPFLVLFTAGIHLANFANGDGYGLPTELPWGIELWNDVRHPVNLYILAFTAILLLFLIFKTNLFNKTGFLRSGQLIGLTIASLGFITVFTRAFFAEKITLAGLDLWQLMGFGLLISGMLIFYLKEYKDRHHVPVMISLGSNQNPVKNLSAGLKSIKSEFKFRGVSSLYRTENVKGNQDSPGFLNQVIEIDVDLSYENLREKLKSLEKDFGRKPGNKVFVPLDLDILTYGNDVFTHQGKQIPDPNLIKYGYIAIPLAELAPDFRHPANGKTIDEIVSQLADKTKIQKIDEVENGFNS